MNDADPAKWFCAKRAPDWRVQQARADAKSRQLRLTSACSEMRRAAMFYAEWDRADAQRRERLRRDGRFRDTAAVLKWYDERDKGVQIEALVLARMTSAYIAKQLGLSTEAVDRYITLCFDVRLALDDAPYILRHAVASERRRGDPTTSRRRTVMKLLAYHCGPQVLSDLYGVNATSESWSHPAAHVRREAALAQLDRSVDRLFGAGDLDPLRSEEVEACLVAVEPYLSQSYAATRTEWLLRQSSMKASPSFEAATSAASPSPAPSGANLTPRQRVEAASNRLNALRREEEALKAQNPSNGKSRDDLPHSVAQAVKDLKSAQREEKLFNEALVVRGAFLTLLSTRATAPPEWLDGPGLSADWNVDVYDPNVEVDDWAQRQLAVRDSQTLVESTLFVDDGAEVRLADAIATPGWPIIVTRDYRDDTPSGFFAGAWTCASTNWMQRFLFDRYAIAYRRNNHGLVMAAADSTEVAAWRRLGVAAIPLPIESIWSAAAEAFWSSLAQTCRAPIPAEMTSVKQVDRIILPPAVLTVSTLDPMTLAVRPDAEWRASAGALRSFWNRHCTDPRVCVGLWEPSATTIESMRASIAGLPSATLDSSIRRSVENELRFLVPAKNNVPPPSTRTSSRQALATISPEAPLAERDELYRRYMESHERHVLEPLQTDETSTKSPIDCVSAYLVIGLSRRLAEIDADLMLAAPTGNADLRTRSNLRNEYCRTASALTSAIKTAKGGPRAS